MRAVLSRVLKPWFVYRPSAVARRAWAAVRPPAAGYAPLPTSWGVPVVADPTRAIGRGIATTGVYDLAVSEAVARLASAGDTVVDAGANVGYMSVLAAAVVGPAGRVVSFEPHPALFAVLQRNAAAVADGFAAAAIDARPQALGDRPGTAELHLPPEFAGNDGVARIDPSAPPGGPTVTVPVTTLDEALGDAPVAVLKMDVEGYEPQVLAGASRLLAGKRIRHVVFEDHAIATSRAAELLVGHGYEVFALGWAVRGPAVRPVAAGPLAASYEAPNYVATADPADLLARLRPRGWRTLRRLAVPHARQPRSG